MVQLITYVHEIGKIILGLHKKVFILIIWNKISKIPLNHIPLPSLVSPNPINQNPTIKSSSSFDFSLYRS